MSNSELEEKALSLIKRYARYRKKYGLHKWESLGESLENLKRDVKDTVSMHDYKRYCDKCDEIERVVDGVYDKYFKVGSMYAHIDGNENWKTLIKK